VTQPGTATAVALDATAATGLPAEDVTARALERIRVYRLAERAAEALNAKAKRLAEHLSGCQEARDEAYDVLASLPELTDAELRAEALQQKLADLQDQLRVETGA
jgi:hypothetical protein